MDALLARIAVGDHEAMRELYLECRPRLWRYLVHLGGVDVTMLDDLLQEIFVAIWRSAPSYRPQGSALAFGRYEGADPHMATKISCCLLYTSTSPRD